MECEVLHNQYSIDINHKILLFIYFLKISDMHLRCTSKYYWHKLNLNLYKVFGSFSFYTWFHVCFQCKCDLRIGVNYKQNLNTITGNL